MQVTKTLVNKGYDPEVNYIRLLKPFDLHTIRNSVSPKNLIGYGYKDNFQSRCQPEQKYCGPLQYCQKKDINRTSS